MSIDINSKPWILLAFIIIMVVAPPPLAAAQQTAVTPVDLPPEVQEPSAVGLTVDTLSAMRARVEASKDLSETDKKSAISYLEAGIRLLEETDRLNAEAQKTTETITAAPEELKKYKRC
jgi:hypothetical protein